MHSPFKQVDPPTPSDAANKQSADFFVKQNRPWVGLDGGLSIDSNGPEGNSYYLRTSYKLKNFGNSPALHIIIWFAQISEEADSYSRTKIEIDKACSSAEQIISKV